MKTKATMWIKRKPGELLEVDWAGSVLSVHDNLSGEIIPSYIFVACLPCSLYSYAEAFPSMVMEHWINAHIHAYQFFGGVTRIVTPDNLKAAVIKHGRTEVLSKKKKSLSSGRYLLPPTKWLSGQLPKYNLIIS